MVKITGKDHMNSEEREEITDELLKAAGKLAGRVADGTVRRELIPDAGICLIHAAEHARSLADIAAVSVMPDGKMSAGGASWDVSADISAEISPDLLFGAAGVGNPDRSVTLTAMRFDPDIRSAAIIRYSKPIVDKAREMLFEVREAVRGNAGGTGPLMDWKTAFCCKKDDVPDIIFVADPTADKERAEKRAENVNTDKTGADCAPTLILLGMDPSALVNNILMLGERINNRN
ncbi:thiamine-phosphate synthase family protein [Methanomicrobium mobile]|uniref:thiamine-phosphate synthase family protein n=1 Tax=Methanomicrobium mobile TaxID=2205 RepID=UPI0005B28326|nr:thiamine-phosphate synthase family protein [Methanomicrobium mobile]